MVVAHQVCEIEILTYRVALRSIVSLLLAHPRRSCDLKPMPHRPPRKKKQQPEPGELDHRRDRFEQLSEQRRRELATRSTLSRLRNRKSDLK